jgi:hypothetical protein
LNETCDCCWSATSRTSQDEQEAIKRARESKSKRRPAIRFGLHQKGKNRVTSASLHSDQAGWRDRLHNAFGTRSQDFLDAELQRILPMFRGKDGKIDTVAVEAVLAVLDGSEPQNEIEAMLVIQMATTHALAMKLSRRLATVDTIEQNDSASITLTRLQRTFTTQVEALANLRRGGKQKMTVEHVHVHPGGQAIVGNVTTGGRGEEGANGRQTHAIEGSRLAIDSAVWRQDEKRPSLPIPSGDRQAPLSHARRSTGNRSPEGRAQRKLSARPENDRGNG